MALRNVCLALLLAGGQEGERGIATGAAPGLEHEASYARRHALVVGIDEYVDPGYPDLGYAVADARAVASLLVERFEFAEDDVRLILNEDATHDTLREALEEWACAPDRVGEEDLLVIFFAGHGVTRQLGRRGQRGYLVPVDGTQGRSGEPNWSTLLGMNDLADVSEAVPAKHVLAILDCCFGGLAVSRSAPPVAAGLSNRARQVITAGNADQPVLDTGGGGHSVFTGALLAGLEGAADVDADGVVTFGELYNHIGREVERKTESRQTPLQATFPDHEGGSVALFPPGTQPGAMTAAQRLKAMARSAEEQLAEVKRLSDALLVQDLVHQADDLWPPGPDLVARYRDWLAGARSLLARLPQHEESVRRVRQEAYLAQLVAGLVEEGAGTELDWARADPDLRWRFETFDRLVSGLGELEALVSDVEGRLEVSETLWQRSIGDHEDLWAEAIAGVAETGLFDDLELTPQLGLVPLGADPSSGLWEFAHLLTGEIAERDASTGQLLLTEETGVVLVLVPGDTFWMGALRGDRWARGDEGPAHEVTLDPYFLSKYEMTQGQWLRVRGENPSLYGPGNRWETTWNRSRLAASLLHPVTNVSWSDCERTLSMVGLLLPTEAQWEYAARGGTQTAWWSGSEISSLSGVANVADAWAAAHGGEVWACEEELDDGFTVHAPVGSLLDNAMGFHDVHGNVWEWCRDWYGSYSFPVRSGDGERLVTGSAPRATRGGGFINVASTARCAARNADTSENADLTLGLRPAAGVSP